MTEEAQKPAAEKEVATVVVVPEVPVAEKEAPSVPEPEVSDKSVAPATESAVESAAVVVEAEATEEEKAKAVEVEKVIAQSVSFKEESYVVSELPESQRKALDELKQLVQDALNKHEFAEPKKEEKKEDKKEEEPEAEPENKEEEEAVAKTEEAVVAASSAEEPNKEADKAPEPNKEEDKVPEPKKEEAKVPEPKKEEAKVPEPKKEEAKVPEPKKEEAKVPEPKKEEAKVPEPTPEPKKEEVKAPEPTPAVEEKATVAIDDDGAKTVEAIEESVVVAVEETPAEVPVEEAVPEPVADPEEVEIWGIPLMADERSDVVLLKFLRARDYKPKEAFAMLKNTVRWRKQFGIESLLGEDIGAHLAEAAFGHGVDKEGHPVCYNVFGAFQNKELYNTTFGDEQKRSDFIKWRILFLEKSIRKFDFSPSGISTIVQINDLKNSPGLLKRELNQGTEQALKLLTDNYPEFVAKQVFINVPWWYLAFHKVISTFLTQRTKSKLVLAGPSKSAETLFKYISPEQVPVQYGGLSRDDNTEFATSDAVTQVFVKPASKHIIEIPVTQETEQVVWEIRVVGWEVIYGAEFVPTAEDHYTVIVQKARKISAADETVISNSFKVTEPGKIVLTIDNQSSKKKLVLYRYKTKPSCE